jgi:tRNA (guanosine-2'-O-)-methyltransferase
LVDVVATLAPFLTPERIRTIDETLANRTRNLTLVIEDVHDPHNVAACLRSAEAFGLQEVHVIEAATRFSANRKVVQGADKWLEIHRFRSAGSCLAALRARGMVVAGGALTESAVAISQLDFSRPTALVFGSEHDGLSRGLLEASDVLFRIPMQGFTRSFNVSVSAGISLYHAVQARIAALGRSGDLAPDDLAALKARWYRLSVPLADLILARAEKGGGR